MSQENIKLNTNTMHTVIRTGISWNLLLKLVIKRFSL